MTNLTPGNPATNRRVERRTELTLDDLRKPDGPATISIEQAGHILNISRANAFEMARAGRLPTIQITDHRSRVPTAGLLRLLGVGD